MTATSIDALKEAFTLANAEVNAARVDLAQHQDEHSAIYTLGEELDRRVRRGESFLSDIRFIAGQADIDLPDNLTITKEH